MSEELGAPVAPDSKRSGSKLARRVKVYGGLFAFGALCAAHGFFVEPFWPELTTHSVGQGPDAVKVLHLTDLHVADYGRNERWVLEQVDSLRPDVIVMTGDVIRSPLDAEREAAAIKLLKLLKAPLGKFGCVGNHDDWQGPRARAVYVEGGVTLLAAGETASLAGGRLTLHGVSRPSGRPRDGTPGSFDLLLSHYPVVLPRAAQAKMDLVLAGHTHGGQVRVPLWGNLWLPYGSGDYEQGWFEEAGTKMYVCRGMGTSILPVRFFCRPESALISVRLPKP